MLTSLMRIALGLVCMAGALHLQAQQVSVTVTDPLHRFVTGLTLENFEVFEDGVARPVTFFSGTESPVSFAVVSESPSPLAEKIGRKGDEVMQTSSLSDAVRQLMASKNRRKAIILVTAEGTQDVPADIQVLQANSESLLKVGVEYRSSYVLRFQPSVPAGRVEIVVKAPRGLPVLTPNWK